MGGFGIQVVSGTQTNGTDAIATVFAQERKPVSLWNRMKVGVDWRQEVKEREGRKEKLKLYTG